MKLRGGWIELIVYCERCQLVYASPERLFWLNDCVRCEGKLITEVKYWLMVIDNAWRGERS